jgi:hypothetical protein
MKKLVRKEPMVINKNLGSALAVRPEELSASMVPPSSSTDFLAIAKSIGERAFGGASSTSGG